MRVSRIFNQSNQIPLIIRTLVSDEKTLSALGAEIKEPLGQAKDFFSGFDADKTVDVAKLQFAQPIFDAFAEKTDPTFSGRDNTKGPHGEYIEWIAKIYAQRAATKKPILSEDLYKIRDELNYFHHAKAAISEKGLSDNIHDYETYESFTEAITPMYLKWRSKKENGMGLTDEIRSETTILYDGPEGKIVVPHTAKACRFWGRGTKWCISADDNEEAFDDYHSKSPILIYAPRKFKKTDEVLSGKVAVVEGKIYDEADDEIDDMPLYVCALRQAAIANLSKGQGEYVSKFGFGGREEESGEFSSDNEQWGHIIYEAATRYDDNDYHEYSIADLQKYNSEIFSDPGIMLEAVKYWGDLIKYGSDEIKGNFDIALAAIVNGDESCSYINEKLLENEQFIRACVEAGEGYMLEYADETLNDDLDFVLKAIEGSSWAIRYASERLRNDKQFVLGNMNSSWSTLEYAGEELKRDQDFLKQAIQNYPSDIKYVSPKVPNYRELVLIALEHEGVYLEYVDLSLRDDKEVVLKAVQSDGGAFRFTTPRLKSDIEILSTAIRTTSSYGENYALSYFRSKVWSDKTLVPAVVGRAYSFQKCDLEFFDPELYKDRDVILAFAEHDHRALEYASDELLKDKDLIRAFAKHTYKALEYADISIRQDKDFVLEMVELDGRALSVASEVLRQDKDFVLKAIQVDAHAFSGAIGELKSDLDLVRLALQKDGNTIMYADKTIQQDKSWVLFAIQNGASIENISSDFYGDKDVIMAWLSDKANNDLTPIERTDAPIEDRDITLAAAQNGAKPSRFVKEAMKQDAEIALTVINNHGLRDIQMGNYHNSYNVNIELKDFDKSLMEDEEFALGLLDAVKDKNVQSQYEFRANMHKMPALRGCLSFDFDEIIEKLDSAKSRLRVPGNDNEHVIPRLDTENELIAAAVLV